MSNYLNEQTQKYFDVPVYLVEPAQAIEVVDRDGELLGVLEDVGGDYQLRINGVYTAMIEKSTSL